MWLGGVLRTLEGTNPRVGLHGNYWNDGILKPEAPACLQAWIPQHAPRVNRELMAQWTQLPTNRDMMSFYNTRAELCRGSLSTPVPG
jgi:hypothetical protein